MTVPETTTPLQMKPELVEELEKFRAEVERIRAELGDPAKALSPWLRELFDPEVLEHWADDDDDYMNGW